MHFAYPSRAVPVLRGISLRALPGTVTALVGPSGAGKSTVFHLLERFYEPSEGSVLIDGADVRTVSHAWLHSVVGLVAQEPVLFRCSVGENIAYSRNCARAADAEERYEMVTAVFAATAATARMAAAQRRPRRACLRGSNRHQRSCESKGSPHRYFPPQGQDRPRSRCAAQRRSLVVIRIVALARCDGRIRRGDGQRARLHLCDAPRVRH